MNLSHWILSVGINDEASQAIEKIKNTDPAIIISQIKSSLTLFVPRLLGALLLLVISYGFIKAVLGFIKKLLKKSRIDPTLHQFVLGLAKYTIWILVVITSLIILKVPTSPLVAVLGSVGLALSLSLKDSLSNVAGGMSILFSRPFAKGDLIETKSVIGVVKAIDLIYTTIITDDDKTVYLPNGDVSKSVVINYSSNPLKRLDLEFFVPVKSDFEAVKAVVLSILKSSAYVLSQPEPLVLIDGKNDDSYIIMCRTWVKLEHYEAIAGTISKAIDLKLKEIGY